jgi:hypothetical protein
VLRASLAGVAGCARLRFRLYLLRQRLDRAPAARGPRDGLGRIGFGALTASFGAGSLAGVQVLPRLRQKFSLDILIAVATILFAAGLGTLAVTLSPILLCTAMLAAGVAWITILSSLNVAAQMTTAFWVRARALAFYLLVFQGAIAGGSVPSPSPTVRSRSRFARFTWVLSHP